MRLLGVDFGERRIGLAVSDRLGLTAQGLTVLTRRGMPEDLEALSKVAVEQEVERIIVGLPLAMDGTRGPAARRAETFARALERRTGLPVELVDERFTTAQGQRVLLEANVSRRKRKQVADQLAAQLILQQYLEIHRPRTDSSQDA